MTNVGAEFGWPVAITYGVESTLFLATGMTVGTLGEAPLAAHQIALNVASVAFMPLTGKSYAVVAFVAAAYVAAGAAYWLLNLRTAQPALAARRGSS